ncbi:hypothetical protein ACK3SF_03310 [Candidatus Nanosalina sp. VS9-1]|uniref:hypothetical protein n=1 Tax=Candidatus Nanosalina sp. VS9-1 TaxID=3388566 RepID=UPI0039E07246
MNSIMDSKFVIFGKWDNHGNDRNLRLTAQDSQKVDSDVELVFKHGNKHVSDIENVSDLKDVIEFASRRPVEGFGMDEACKAIELFNEYYRAEMDPEEALNGWKLDRKIKS